MDEFEERDIVKRNEQLHNEIGNSIQSLLSLVASTSLTEQDKVGGSSVLFQKLKSSINEFEPSPKLLDSHLTVYIESLTTLFLSVHSRLKESNYITKGIGSTIYNFSKIRGFKFITNYFSSDIYLIGTLIDISNHVSDDDETFLCLIWLSNLALVPFKLSEIDSRIIEWLFETGLKNLKKHANASKNQLVSSILLARLLTRSDTGDTLHYYFTKVVEPEWKNLSKHKESVKLGHLMTINKILKRPEIEMTEPYIDLIYELISIDLLRLREAPESVNNLNITYFIKVLGKLSNFYIRMENYSKVEAIFNNLLHDIMNLLVNKFDTTIRYAMAKSLSGMNHNLSQPAVNYQHQLIVHLIGQLDLELDMNCFSSEVTVNSDNVLISKYHTILLFFGYIALNKSLPLDLIPVILSIVHKTLFIRQRRLTSILGSQLRDTSCFVVWAISRMLKPSQLRELDRNNMIQTILLDLIKTTIFDEDLIIRRCGIAVIQEFVGRFSTELFSAFQDESRGEFTIKFVELFNNQTIKSTTESLSLIEHLVQLGLDRNMFLENLIGNAVNDSNSFEVKKLSAMHLRKVIRLPDVDVLPLGPPTPHYSLEAITEELFQSGNLFLVCELLEGQNVGVYKDQLLNIGTSFSFDYHRDSIERAEGYLKLLNLLSTNLKYNLGDSEWVQLLNIARMTNDSAELIPGFKLLFQNENIRIPNKICERIFYYIENNNNVFPQVVFYYGHYTQEEFQSLVNLTKSAKISCEIRASLVECLSKNFNESSYANDVAILSELLDLLDDYTITNQGDVGSKLRLAMLKMVGRHYGIFVSNPDVMHKLELKFIRLAGEVLDKVRVESFILLNRLHGVVYKEDHHDFSIYYAKLFSFYDEYVLQREENDVLSLQFWRGLCFTVGAKTANRLIINASFAQLLGYLEIMDTDKQKKVLLDLVRLLKLTEAPSPRDLKSCISVLNVYLKLFESNFNFPVDFNFDALYIRCYNLHINTSNMIRIGLVLELFQQLALSPRVSPTLQLKAKKRLLWVAGCHKESKVRILASEILYELSNEVANENAIELIASLKWDQSPIKLKSAIQELELLLQAK
ncbi:uncharacterized protein RJT20DRAFT_55174 [Scheffersomyces xylosifermentans]|uniref:uncharacterized protein n=1 Tax=Scheffersomyces xylosifermentans TaxID=1304137 RepID=UPI00315DB067